MYRFYNFANSLLIAAIIAALVFVVTFLAWAVFLEHRSWITKIWARIRPMLSLLKRKQRSSDWQDRITVLQRSISFLKQEMESTGTTSHYAELSTLVRTLAHLGTPGDTRRLTLEDLVFYQDEISKLAGRFHTDPRLRVAREQQSHVHPVHRPLSLPL